MKIVLAKNAKMMLPKAANGKYKPMLTKLGFANESKCKWVVKCSPRLDLVNQLGAGSIPISGNTMREIEKLSGQIRVYLIGHKGKNTIGLQIGDSNNKILARMLHLLKYDKELTKFTARVYYRGEEITSEGFEDSVWHFVQGNAFHEHIMTDRDQAASVFGGKSLAKAVEQRKVDPNGFTLTLSITL